MGTSSVVYVSIPDTTSTCANLGLPQLPPSWSYRCVSSSTLQNIDGTGWIPINFNNLSFGKTLPKLPIDPINTTSSGNYYTYVSGGSFELTSLLESSKYQNLAINDGDAFPGLYSTRTSANPLTPGLRDKGLVGYWSFDEASGTIAYDYSGYNNNGTMYSSTTVSDLHINSGCKNNSCSNFDGIDDYIDVGSGASLNNFNTITIEAWVNPNTFVGPSSYGGPISANNIMLRSYENTGYSFQFYVKIGSNWEPRASFNYSNLNIWYHIVSVYDKDGGSNNLRIYINGELKNSQTRTGPINNPLTGWYIGKVSYGDYYMKGLIDEVRIYNRALNNTEIKAIYNAIK
jgi:hypothetical protein